MRKGGDEHVLAELDAECSAIDRQSELLFLLTNMQ